MSRYRENRRAHNTADVPGIQIRIRVKWRIHFYAVPQCNSSFIFHLRPSRACPPCSGKCTYRTVVAAAGRKRGKGTGCLSRKSDSKDRSNGERADRILSLYLSRISFRLCRVARWLLLFRSRVIPGLYNIPDIPLTIEFSRYFIP